MDRHTYEPQYIYKVDKTGQRPDKLVARRGIRQVGAVTSVERGTLVTANFDPLGIYISTGSVS